MMDSFIKYHLILFRLQFSITNDAREDEMEDNMGQVNTMIGNIYSFNLINYTNEN